MARMNWKDLWSRAWVRNTAFWAFLVLLYVVFGIEDWGRDLVGYQAEASFQPSSRYVARLLELPPGHPDFVAQADWVEAIKWAGNRISNLEYKGDASDGNTVVLTFVRQHRLLRLRDDVQVRLRFDGSRAVIDGNSEARLHIGDLGRNPGTLRRFFFELEDVIAESNLNPQIGFR